MVWYDKIMPTLYKKKMFLWYHKIDVLISQKRLCSNVFWKIWYILSQTRLLVRTTPKAWLFSILLFSAEALQCYECVDCNDGFDPNAGSVLEVPCAGSCMKAKLNGSEYTVDHTHTKTHTILSEYWRRLQGIVCTTEDHTFYSIPGMHCIFGKWPMRIRLWYANFETLLRLILEKY